MNNKKEKLLSKIHKQDLVDNKSYHNFIKKYLMHRYIDYIHQKLDIYKSCLDYLNNLYGRA